ncbi:glycoside hydrolase family protein [Tolypothrix sp. NIES-4075]|nr:glycoside hydrolase family protein [Tolypothrix sp. NIES-4075]
MQGREWAVTLDDAEWAKVPFEVRETEATVEIETEEIRVFIQRQNCRITCFDKANRPFAQDADMGIDWGMGAVAAWKQIAAFPFAFPLLPYAQKKKICTKVDVKII